VYAINASLEENPVKINSALETKGKFILATNELDHSKLSNINLLPIYKEQQCVERGFRFLKDPLFMTSSVFLKNQKRIVALSMIMCLCLLVYSLAQRLLRKRISQLQTNVSNQNGKPTTKPTIRWIFQIFEGVHLLIHKTKDKLSQLVLNLTHQRLLILEILGPHYQIMYQNFI
jgi:transposase